MHKNAVVIATLIICIVLVMAVWPLGFMAGLKAGEAAEEKSAAAARVSAYAPGVAAAPAKPAKKITTRVTRAVLA